MQNNNTDWLFDLALQANPRALVRITRLTPHQLARDTPMPARLQATKGNTHTHTHESLHKRRAGSGRGIVMSPHVYLLHHFHTSHRDYICDRSTHRQGIWREGREKINKQVNHFAHMLKVCSLHLNLVQNEPITALILGALTLIIVLLAFQRRG